MLVAVTGVVAVTLYAGVALMQILVWNPEAAVPGGGDYALGGVLLYGVSVLAMIGLFGIFVGALVRHRRGRRALATAGLFVSEA